MIARLENWDADVIVQNYHYGEQLKADNGHLKGVKIALACLKAEVVKSLYDTASITSWAWNAIRLRGFGVSNAREIGLTVSEHKRNLEGILAAPFVSPQYAIEKYLPLGPDATPQDPRVEAEIGRLYAVAEAVDFVFTKLGYHYTACSGTVLGRERSQSFIKGDDDVDLEFDEKLLPYMQFLFDEKIFEKITGLKVHNQKKHTSGWQCYHPEATKPVGKNDVAAEYFVDVMPAREEGGKMVFTHDGMRQRFQNDYMTTQEFNEVEKKPFGPIAINVPKEALNYIIRAYHEQAMKISYKFPSHHVMGGAIANWTSPSHWWAFVQGVFESRRRLAITTPTSYNEQVYATAKKEIFERIHAFQEELKVNAELAEKFQKNTIPYRVFVDGVYDLFHQGHVKSFEKARRIAEEKAFGRKVVLIVGVTSDEESKSYKRLPIMSEQERENAVRNNLLVQEVVSHSPTDGPSRAFLVANKINLVLHGDDFNEQKCRQYYSNAMDLGIFSLYPYEPGVSTTQLLKSANEEGKFPETFINQTGISSEELVARIRNRN